MEYCWREALMYLQLSNVSTNASSTKYLISCTYFQNLSAPPFFAHHSQVASKWSSVWRFDDNRWIISILHNHTVSKDPTLLKGVRYCTFKREKCAEVRVCQGYRLETFSKSSCRLRKEGACGNRTEIDVCAFMVAKPVQQNIMSHNENKENWLQLWSEGRNVLYYKAMY